MSLPYAVACQAIASDDLDLLKNEIEHNPASVLEHWKPLVDAAFLGKIESTELLLAKGVNPNIRGKGKTSHTALTRICQPHKTIGRTDAHTQIVKILLEKGADPLLPGGMDELIPLVWSYMKAESPFIEVLEEPTMKASDRLVDQSVILLHAAKYDIAALRAHNPSSVLSIRDQCGRNALHYVALAGGYVRDGSIRSLDCARFLCEDIGIDPNEAQVIPEGDEDFLATPLWWTLSRQSNYLLAKYLLERHTDPDNCVFTASFSGELEAVELLHEYSADWNTKFHGMTPMMDLVTYNRPKLIPWLLTHGADATIKDSNGKTVLHHAAQRGIKNELLQIFIEHGCDPNERDNEGHTPADLARIKNRTKTIAFFDDL